MRIVFVLQYPGYLRYFDSVIGLLSAQGHDVHLFFEQPAKQAEAIGPFRERHGDVALAGLLPKSDDKWRFMLAAIRRANGYVRYLDPAFREATYLRSRARTRIPPLAAPLAHLETLPRPIVRAMLKGLLALEWAIPRSGTLDGFVAELDPDILVVSPFVMIASRQADLVRAARARGIPTVAAIASWDHLTTKGVARPGPDLFLVWNEKQVDEAMTLHGIPRSKIVVTGAQPFDRWFDRVASRSRDEFCARVGLPATDRFVLFTGSTASISKPDAEKAFVRAWVTALRDSSDPIVRELGVLIRPHPYNSEGWRGVDVSDLTNTAIWPRTGANPLDEADRSDYFDSIYHSCAVVGVNTSAMIEAAVIGRPVMTVESREFSETQAGTLHYRYLLPESGGFTRVASTFDEHTRQLGNVIRDPQLLAAERETFVRSFIRPLGVDAPATQRVADAIVRAPLHASPASDPGKWYHLPLRAIMRPAVPIATRRGLERKARKRRAAGVRGEP